MEMEKPHRRTWLQKMAPKKFFCCCDLQAGCKFVGYFLAIVMAGCIAATVVQIIGLEACTGCKYNSWKHAYGYSIAASIYCCLMFLVNLLYIWAVTEEDMSMIIAWVGVTAMWLAHTACLLLVLVVKYKSRVGIIVWCVCLGCTIAVVLLLAYFVLAGYGYWLELRDRPAPVIVMAETPEKSLIQRFLGLFRKKK